MDRRLAVALGALFTVLVASTAILRAGLPAALRERQSLALSLLDAAYFTVETVTTVGYGDYSSSAVRVRG